MKKSNYLLLAFSILLLVSCKKNASYETKEQTDVNGYSYETVANDPTGLRLYTLENGLKVYLSQFLHLQIL